MKLFGIIIVAFFPVLAAADTYYCKLTGLNQGQIIREFMLQPPKEGRILTALPGSTYRITVWTYEASVGIEIENLVNQSTELSTQMTFDTHGIFDLTFRAADLRLTCSFEQ